MAQPVLDERLGPDGAIAVLTLNRPEKLNAISAETARELLEALNRYVKLPAVRSVVLTGAGMAFSAGADISAYQNASAPDVAAFLRLCRSVCTAIEDHPVPVVAAVNGPALGGGFELALACDLMVASSAATFGLPEVSIGLLPGWYGTQRLLTHVPPALVKELLFTGRRISAAEAREIGFVNLTVPPDEVVTATVDYVSTMCAASPAALREIKSVVNHGLRHGFAAGAAAEQHALLRLMADPEARSAIAAFGSKPPRTQV